MNECTRNGCNGEKANGDGLFCITHRNGWIEYCKKIGIHEKIVDDVIVTNKLKIYQRTEDTK